MNNQPRDFIPGMGQHDDGDHMKHMEHMNHMEHMGQMEHMNHMENMDRMDDLDPADPMNRMNRDIYPPGAFPALPPDASVTMAYIPFQLNTEVYDDMKALQEGTLFPVLNKPFLGAYAR